METQPHEAHEPGPESSALPNGARSRRLTIRPSGSGWCLEDSDGAVGGLFTTLGTALTFCWRERSCSGGSLCVVVPRNDRHDRASLAA
jgi:hypothetical protein